MSLSNPKAGKNPAKKRIQWSGSLAKWQYYDKEKGDPEKKYKVDMPEKFYIIALDQLNSVTGFNKKEQKGIFSNEVKDLNTETLIVRMKGEKIAEGLWEDIKEHVTSSKVGGKFEKSIYAALFIPKGKDVPPDLELINIRLSGSSLGPWFDAQIGDVANVITLGANPEKQVSGTNEYYMPTVKLGAKRDDLTSLAIEMDKELQEYFQSKGKPTGESEEQPETPPPPTKEDEQWMSNAAPEEEDDDLPF